MTIRDIDDVEKLRKINAALIGRVERSMDQQGNAFSLFQTAINLENRVRSRTEELRAALHRLEQTNADLVTAKETAEQANLSKTRFLAAAGHDVLQPLNAAHLSVSALAEIQQSEEGRRLVRQIERSLTSMDELLRALLDISKFDAGVVDPDMADVALDQVFSALRSDFQPIADRKQLALRIRPCGFVVRSDRTLLRRILQNILSNALRYTRSGGVLVGARLRGDRVRIDIADTGSGIPDDYHDAVFQEFQRGPAPGDGGAAGGGLGLGLAIVRRLAAMLGHSIDFSSRIERGTVFHVTLPRVAVEAAPPPPADRVDTGRPRGYGLFGTKVLLVENDPGVLEAMSSLLRHWHCDVRTAISTSEALDALGDTAWIPDVIIADQNLDGGDLGSVTVLEARDYLGRAVPALIVTADGSEQALQVARAAGAELMRKPVKPAQLRALLAHMLA